MKTIGLIGGTTWISTVDYYTYINKEINRALGGVHSANLLLYSVDFDDFRKVVSSKAEMAAMVTAIAIKLQTAGAECIAFCGNTPHLVAGEVQSKIKIPIIHVAESVAVELSAARITTVGLLGTKITMEQGLFADTLEGAGIAPIIPGQEDREFIHSAVFNGLGKGIFSPQTKGRFIAIIDELIEAGAQGVILGCTEFPHLLKGERLAIPTFDTAHIHASAIAKFAS